MIRFSVSTAAGIESFDVPDLSFTVGRALGNSVVLACPTVSAFHLEVKWEKTSYRIRDMASANGVWSSEGAKIDEASFSGSLSLTLGSVDCRLDVLDPVFVSDAGGLFLGAKREFCVGRAESNDWVLTDPTVSLHHARFILDEGSVVVENLSRQLLLVGGLPVTIGPVVPGETVQCGLASITLQPVLEAEGSRLQLLPWQGTTGEIGLSAVGALGREEAGALLTALNDLRAAGAHCVHLDLSRCTQLHPRALEVILQNSRIDRGEKSIVVVNPSSAVKRAFSLSNAGKILNLVHR